MQGDDDEFRVDSPLKQEPRPLEECEQRARLPFLKDPLDKPSVWQILKDSIGKDLSRFCVPVYFNEPLTMMQRVGEIMEYE